jgi:hypothetical protein
VKLQDISQEKIWNFPSQEMLKEFIGECYFFRVGKKNLENANRLPCMAIYHHFLHFPNLGDIKYSN